MFDPLRIGYLLATFVTGIACFSTVLVLARRRENPLAQWFLLFYVALSLLVGAALLLALTDSAPSASPPVRTGVQYLESFVGRYAVLLALPLFAHRVYGVPGKRPDLILLGITLVTFAAQHATEYRLGGRWDEAGDIGEDLVYAGVVAYTLWIGFSRLRKGAGRRPLALPFFILLLIGLPVIAHDLFLSENTTRRFYPLWYCGVSAWCLP